MFSERIRFNWGFHDGQHAQEMGWSPEWERGKHYDAAYEDGYWRGAQAFKDNGARSQLSDDAWAAREAAQSRVVA